MHDSRAMDVHGRASCGSILDNKYVPAQPTSAVLARCPARRATTLTLPLHPAVIDMASNMGYRIKRPKDVLVQQLVLINAATAGRQHVVAALANGTTIRLGEGPSLYRAADGSGHCPTAATCECSFYEVLIFFPTMTPIDKRPPSGPAHGWHVSACQISLPSIEPFRRR